MEMRWQPTVRVAHPYYDTPAYIDALAAAMQKDLAALDFEPEVVLASFHGIPEDYALKGDPYDKQCARTVELLRQKLGWSPDRLKLTFQSRFGRAEWLRPYTDETVISLAKSGVKKMAIVAPGFSADCLETLEELDGENREFFMHNGGERFAYLTALNDRDEGMAVIRDIAERELMGWV